MDKAEEDNFATDGAQMNTDEETKCPSLICVHLCPICGKSHLVFLLLLSVAGSALAIDFKKEVGPRKWVERLVPEDLPPLKYPEYFETLDKAKEQIASGRYKLALVTL